MGKFIDKSVRRLNQISDDPYYDPLGDWLKYSRISLEDRTELIDISKNYLDRECELKIISMRLSWICKELGVDRYDKAFNEIVRLKSTIAELKLKLGETK